MSEEVTGMNITYNPFGDEPDAMFYPTTRIPEQYKSIYQWMLNHDHKPVICGDTAFSIVKRPCATPS